MAGKKKTTWGGPRPGSGRPRGVKSPWVTRSLAFRPVVIDAVDAAAEAEGVSRSAWIATAIEKELKRAARRKS